MPMRNYKGAGLPGVPITATPPPSPPPVLPREAPQVVPVEKPLARIEPTPEVGQGGISVDIIDTYIGTTVTGAGATVEEAMQQALLQYESVQPVVPLQFADGRPVEGMSRQVLVEALETYQQYLGDTGTPEITLIIGRLKGALGEA